jgi:predicted enzyme related to lactoylglutathione lyase
MKKNAVAHFEIYGDDPEKLAQFYTTMFDWKAEPVPGMAYTMLRTVDTDGTGAPTQTGGINGGLLKRPTPELRGFINYVNVDSVDGAVERAQKLGAKLMKGRSAVPGMGWFAMLFDPQGNPFAVWQQDPKAV